MSQDSQHESPTPDEHSIPVQNDQAPPSPQAGEDVAELKSQLKQAQAKAAEHWDKLLRATADFENFKKRAIKERAETARYAAQPLLHSLLTILDNLEAALAAADQSGQDSVESLKTGIQMICQQFKTALTESGLAEIDAQGQVFDPNLHEAVSQQESSEHPEGHVMHQLRKGYKLHDRLLRPASVVVAKAPEGSQAESAPSSNDDSK